MIGSDVLHQNHANALLRQGSEFHVKILDWVECQLTNAATIEL